MTIFAWNKCVKIQITKLSMCISMFITSFSLLQLFCDIIYFVITYWLFNYQYMTAHSGSKVLFIRTELQR